MKPIQQTHKSRLEVFLDSSAIVAGIASETGASGAVLDLCEAELVVPVISKQVVVEVDRAISNKLPFLVEKLRVFLLELRPIMVEDPSAEAIRRAAHLTHEKDAAILAAAQAAGVDYLLTLDKKHFLNPRQKIKFEPPVLTPGEFLRVFEKWALRR
ncbi:MAG: PIN domain-containing protein [Deltaproteobacteria bacterium]|nr:PIN domain-containing protein [Deltaproteobacteria bacterium]MBW2345504.1 PIN domain-containing protein [Deltaproteobacteria bacterium]